MSRNNLQAQSVDITQARINKANQKDYAPALSANNTRPINTDHMLAEKEEHI